MTTQNVNMYRTTFANLTQAGSPYYYPSSAGMNLDGFDHLAVRLSLTAGALNTVTASIWSDDGSGLWVWNETMGFYSWRTGVWGAASLAAAAGTTALDRYTAWNHNARLWRVRIVIVDGGAVSNSGIIGLRGIKV